jgi:hypothetical protein
VSKPVTHYAKPMTTGECICGAVKPAVYTMGIGPHPWLVHDSTGLLVDDIRHVTSKRCRAVYFASGKRRKGALA